ncbi:MAG: class I SAM-dependent methyltransferase [Candidatus Woesearchaeota archaeon]|nr:class I SAM-dependent methyltransferase [Candidatus Woesearchaeota archaeon]
MTTSLPLLERVTEHSLSALPNVAEAYSPSEGRYRVALNTSDESFLLTNRSFDIINNWMGDRLHESITERLAEGEEVRVIDIGAGYDARAASEILATHPSPRLSVYAIDLFAQEKSEKDPRLTIIRGDFRTLSLPVNSFDLLYSCQLMEYLYQQKDPAAFEAYALFFHMLKPGGEACIDDYWRLTNAADFIRTLGAQESRTVREGKAFSHPHVYFKR